jgi:hypothetical protein
MSEKNNQTVIREAVEAAFEEREGWRVKIAAAVRALGDATPSASPAALTDVANLVAEWDADEPVNPISWPNRAAEVLRALLAAQPAEDAPTFNHGDWIRNNYQDYPNIASLVVAMNQAERAAEPATADRQGVALSDQEDEEEGPTPLVEWDKFPGWLIDHHEGDIITEELLQHALADMLKVHPARASSSRAEVEIPEGYALVPKEPTARMKAAGNGALAPWIAPAMHAEDAYAAMLAAAESLRAEVEREAGLGAALMDVCESLPTGCGVVINAENGWAGVTFCDADGNEFDMDDGETSITNQVRKAIAAAEAPNGETPE